MRPAAAGLAAAWVLLQVPTAFAQDGSAPQAEASAYGPAPPPPVMGPFPENGAPPAAVEEDATAPSPEGSPGEFDRLFGEEDASASAPSTPPRLPTPQMPLWLWGLLGLMLLALLVSRRALLPGKRGAADQGIQVTSRTSLGREGNLAVVEVGDGSGGRRRLLVGFGSGAPRLVADLTPMPEVLALAQETLGPRPVPTVVEAEETQAPPQRRRRPVAPPPRTEPTLEAAPAETGPGNSLTTSQRWESALEAEGAAPARRSKPRPLESRGDLIAEVLAERTRRSVEVGGEIDLDDTLPADEEPAVRGTYTFRGTQG